ncbi:putative Serine/threonine protein kinase FSK [Rhodotorula toruloides ATCC 204091]|uniref:non-specific serine/threonine protein kinase n=1 Tax=Rhodotorula toruloides TaxID=5286 RepID=A0A0K3CLW8_RHOTO|nr:putative Serine/threonine protein kinase FSK [Rhodotorula toruloides ATCC 204091]PRQ71910.1 putative Serine/threonine protein kinase FSK [Rhodotorula toruloides]
MSDSTPAPTSSSTASTEAAPEPSDDRTSHLSHSSSYLSSGAATPSTAPATPALSLNEHDLASSASPSVGGGTPALGSSGYQHSYHYDSPSIPATPSEFGASSVTQFVPNPALALDTPSRELGNLSLAATPSPPLGSEDGHDGAPRVGGPMTGVGSEAHRLSSHSFAPRPSGGAGGTSGAEEIIARTSAGQQALKEGVLPGSKGLTASGVPVPGPAAGSEGGGGGGTPNLVPSTAVTPGTSRTGTPAPSAALKDKNHLPPPPSSSAAPRRPNIDGRTGADAAPVKEGKKSMFGKLFDRDRNSSSLSVATDGGGGGSGGEAMERRGSASGGPVLERRTSGLGSRKEDKERKEREKAERKEREKREKEEEKERKVERERARSASRTPSQTGRPRSDSHGNKEKEGGGVMDFMRIKVQRKTSVTSRKSDDGRSEKSHAGESQYGGSETKSRGGQSNASLSKKYGVCDKVIVGKGATAVVRLAHKWDRSTEKLYAVKEFRKRRKNETEKEYVKKLTSEFCISSTLHHHNVVETVDLVQDEQQHWCEVMEYCPGGDLYAVIKKGDLGTSEINSYFKQILAGVAYLHSMGVAHRDIKPENLLLDAKGHVKITDFGVSDVFRMCWEKTTHLSKGLCGSEPYIAPEQFEQKEYDARLVDIWAVAVVYYCMTYQELPWRVAKSSDPSFGPYLHAYRTSSSTPPPVSNIVPREARSLIRRMLDPDPKTRLTTDAIIADAWFAAIEVIPPLEGILPPKPNAP